VAFANKAIDVAVQAEPSATLAEDQQVATRWREISDVRPRIQYTVILFSPDFAARQTDVARRWMTAYLQGVRDYNDAFIRKSRDQADLVAILTKWTAVKDSSLYQKMGYPYVDPNGIVDET